MASPCLINNSIWNPWDFHEASHWLTVKVALDSFSYLFGARTHTREYKVRPGSFIFLFEVGLVGKISIEVGNYFFSEQL